MTRSAAKNLHPNEPVSLSWEFVENTFRKMSDDKQGSAAIHEKIRSGNSANGQTGKKKERYP
jgi:hypothetical protein